MGSTILRLGFATAAAAALMTTTAACSSAATTGPTAGPESVSTSSQLADTPAPGDHDAFTACLTDHGVPAPPEGGPGGHGPGGPGGPGGQPPAGPPPSGAPQPGQGGTPPAPPGVDQATWDTAMQACRSLAPAPPPR